MAADRPVVLVDQDGPLANFDRAFYDLCAERGWELHSDYGTQCHRFATDCMLDRKEASKARDVVNNTRWFRDLPVVDGAVEGIHELAEHADVWIVTKPLEANPWCRDDKAAWVRRHLGEHWERQLILAPDKSLVRGDVLLDDAIKIRWIARAEWQPVAFPTPWNNSGSDWAELPRWTWGYPVDELLGVAH